MRITDIIRGVLDLADMVADAQQPHPDTLVAIAQQEEPQPQDDGMLAIIQQLAGVPVQQEPEYANEPCEMTAPIGASFPGGDDVHSRKNPADIRTNAPSMYPNFQAKQ
jgi:hypothetical protein